MAPKVQATKDNRQTELHHNKNQLCKGRYQERDKTTPKMGKNISKSYI